MSDTSPREPQARIGKRQLLSLSALFLLLLAGVWADPLFLRRNFAGRDPMVYHYPLEKAIHDAYARGRLPVWVSEISGGRPLLANPNLGALYPVRPILSAVSFPWAARIFPILHWAISSVGMFLLLGVLGVSAAGAWVGAVTYVFSAVSISYAFYPNIHPGMALLPYVVWAVARRSSSPGRGALVVSLVWALLFLSGDAFVLSLGFVACLLWIALESRDSWKERSLRLAVGLALAGLAAAPQIVASALWIPETTRAIRGLTWGAVVLFSISPFRLLEFLVPFPFGAVWSLDSGQSWGTPLYHGKLVGFFTSFYAGAFAVIAVVLTWRLREKGARFGRWMLAAGLVLSVPTSLVPASWGRSFSPLPLRYPEKFAVGLILALATLAGLGFDVWRRTRPRAAPLIAVAAGITLLAILAALLPGPVGAGTVRAIGAGPKYAPIAGRGVPPALAEAGLLWILTLIGLEAAKGTTRFSLVLSLGLLTAVPVAANRKIARTFPEDHLFRPSPLDRYLARVDPRGEFRTFDEQIYLTPSALRESDLPLDISASAFAHRSWQSFSHLLWGRGTVLNNDVDAGDFSRVDSLRRLSFLAAQYRDSASFFGSLALKWGVRLRDQKPIAGYRRIGGNNLVDWDEHEAAYPDVRLVQKWHEETGSLDALKTLRRLAPGEIVVESGRKGVGSARPGTLRVLERSPERLLVETQSSDPAWLFVLRAHWSHRTILLDGTPVAASPAQLAFSAVAIPAGSHRIDWQEEIPGISLSRWGPLLFAVAAAALAGKWRGHAG